MIPLDMQGNYVDAIYANIMGVNDLARRDVHTDGAYINAEVTKVSKDHPLLHAPEKYFLWHCLSNCANSEVTKVSKSHCLLQGIFRI